MAESINSLHKAEVIYKSGRSCYKLEDVEIATLRWVDWFNHWRQLQPIGDIPPAEFKQMFYDNPELRNVARLR